MYLWQIRHIPDNWQTFFKFTLWLIVLMGVLGLCGLTVRPVVGQTNNGLQSEQSKSASRADQDSGNPAAAAFVTRIHEELRKHATVKADIEQAVSIGNQKFQSTGRYLSSGSRLRLEYIIKPDQGTSGSLIEVCDGKELWSLMTLANSKRVTHRDVQQIKAAALSAKDIPDAVLSAELGLGGLTALLASLERTMTFDALKTEENEGHSRTIVQGRWKDSIIGRWKRKPEDPLPIYIPDLVRLIVDSETLFPERIIYLKENMKSSADGKGGKSPADKSSYHALVSLRFQKVEINAPIDDAEFTFVPPEDVVPEDITRQYLDRLSKSQEPTTPGSTTNSTKPLSK